MLVDPARHEALAGADWDPERVRAGVAAIVDDAERHRRADGQWPVHPRDDEGDVPPGGFKSIYLGSAGVLWALAWLQRAGAVRLGRIDPADAIGAVEAAYRADPDTGQVVPSFFLGEAGILLVRWALTGAVEAADAADRLHASVQSNIANPTNEALWAAPGTMVAAWHLWQASGADRWRRLFLDNVEQLWRTWVDDEAAGCPLWTQDLYGRIVQYLGAGHGFAGNVYPLLRGAALLDPARREALYRRCEHTLTTTAHREGATANWPPGTFATRPGTSRYLVQWCHGAPGIVTATADFPPARSAALDALLAAAGETVWQAGPLTKGPGLCHGTAGNGYALLKLYRRSGDPLWLARARALAMHALRQCDLARRQHGMGRHTLWTGDLGAAVYLQHCLDGTAELPLLDFVR